MAAQKATETVIATYERDGVVCLRGVLNQDQIEALRDGVELQLSEHGSSASSFDFNSIAEQVWAGDGAVDTKAADRFNFETVRQRVLKDPGARPLREDIPPDQKGAAFIYDAALWRRHYGMRSVALDSALPGTIASLLKTERLHFWEDTTFVKEPGTPQKTAFHQDLGYFNVDGEQCVIVWVPLDPVDKENGSLKYVRGSHKEGKVYAPNVMFAHSLASNAVGELVPDIEADPTAYDIIQFDAEPGDVIVHHVRMIHGSDGNMSKRRRRAVSLRYCGDDVRYLERQGAVGQIGITHDLKSGDRLDSIDYPLVYPRPWPEFKLADAYSVQGLQRAAE